MSLLKHLFRRGRTAKIEFMQIEDAGCNYGLRPLPPADLLLNAQNIDYSDIKFLELSRGRSDFVIKGAIVPLYLHAANLFQLLPASRHDHHRHWGGLLQHSLDVASINRAEDTDYQERELRGQMHTGVEEAARAALLVGAGLFHDVGKLVTDIAVYGYRKSFPDTPLVYEPSIENMVYLPLYDWCVKNDIGGYRFAFRPNRKLNAHSEFSLKFLKALLGKLGFNATERINQALSSPKSRFQRDLLKSVSDHDRRSVEKYRDHHPVQGACPVQQLADALWYAAQETRLLDSAPIVDGKLFISSSQFSQVSRSLPEYDDFHGVRNSPRFERDILNSGLCEQLKSGAMLASHDGSPGLFLKAGTKFTIELIDVLASKHKPGVVESRKNDTQGVATELVLKLSPRSEAFLRAVLRLVDQSENVHLDEDSMCVDVSEAFGAYASSDNPPTQKSLVKALMSDGLLIHQNGNSVRLSVSLTALETHFARSE